MAANTSYDRFPETDYKECRRQRLNREKLRHSHGKLFASSLCKQLLCSPEFSEQIHKLNCNNVQIESYPPSVAIQFQPFPPFLPLLKYHAAYGLVSEKINPIEDSEEDMKKLILELRMAYFSEKPRAEDMSPNIFAIHRANFRNSIPLRDHSNRERQVRNPRLRTVKLNFLSQHQLQAEISRHVGRIQIEHDESQKFHILDLSCDETLLLSGNKVSYKQESTCGGIEMKRYDDPVEQTLILVPRHLRRGWKARLKHNIYNISTIACFTSGDRNFPRCFDLRLKLTEFPQQYTLNFFFMLKSGRVAVFRLFLTVYSILPASSHVASLTFLKPDIKERTNCSSDLEEVDDETKHLEIVDSNPEALLATHFVSYLKQDFKKRPRREADEERVYDVKWRHHEKLENRSKAIGWDRRLARLDFLWVKHNRKQEIRHNIRIDLQAYEHER